MTVSVVKWNLTTLLLFSLCSIVLASWSPWGEYTRCSRTCGGGVKFRERLCLVDRLDRPVCKGKKRNYKLCNTQDCEGDVKDFRADQCQKYNSQPLNGVLYDWKPYYGHGETCELLCFANGFPFFHKLADKVVDGTLCMHDKNRICIDGQCKSIGCDMKIGSRKVIDVCGVCGGDNSTCSVTGDVNGIFAEMPLPPGYSTIVEIPVGARDIFIKEIAENKNSIVFWDSRGENFAIDKETRKQVPSVMLAGTQFNYKSADSQNTFGEIKAVGPTLRKITVYAVNEGEVNPGIRYSYKLPNVNQEFQSNASLSKSGEKNKNVSDSDKQILKKPSNIRVNTSHLPSRRMYGQTNVRVVDRRPRPVDTNDFRRYRGGSDDSNENKKKFVYQNAVQVLGGKKSITDNLYDKSEKEHGYEEEGTTERTIEITTDRAIGEEGFQYFVANEIKYGTNNEELDRMELESRGPETVYTNQRFMWSHGQWSECSNNCGEGYQRRIVSCIDRERRETVDQEYCDLELRPSNSRRCNSGDCRTIPSSSYVRWQVGKWGPCSTTCEIGDQVQEVFCEAVYNESYTKQVDDEQCLNQYRMKPQYRRSCNDGVPCDIGNRDSNQVRDNSRVGSMWMFSKWSQCSVSCGDGVQRRSVNCRSKSDQRQVLREEQCNAEIKPVSRRRCQMAQCPPNRQRERPDRRQGCMNTYYGCCPDGVTPARGALGAGCPSGSVDQKLVRVGGRQILECAQLPEQYKGNTYVLEWTKQGQASPIYKQYRWKWDSFQTDKPEINPNFEGRIQIYDETSLQIRPVVETDSGLYTCTLLVPLSRSNSRKYSNQVFLDAREIENSSYFQQTVFNKLTTDLQGN